MILTGKTEVLREKPVPLLLNTDGNYTGIHVMALDNVPSSLEGRLESPCTFVLLVRRH